MNVSLYVFTYVSMQIIIIPYSIQNLTEHSITRSHSTNGRPQVITRVETVSATMQGTVGLDNLLHFTSVCYPMLYGPPSVTKYRLPPPIIIRIINTITICIITTIMSY